VPELQVPLDEKVRTVLAPLQVGPGGALQVMFDDG
jgi:hypothetical protein